MLTIKREGVLLRPTKQKFESRAVFNPGIWQDGETVEMLYRAVDEDHISSIGYAKLDGPLTVAERFNEPVYAPVKKWESHGMEDPRIVKVDNEFLVTYVAHDGVNAVSACLRGKNLKKLKRGGLLSPKIKYRDLPKLWQAAKLKDEYFFFEAFYEKFGDKNIYVWHKDFVPFPERVGGSLMFLERVLPDVQLVTADSLGDLKNKFFWYKEWMRTDRRLVLEPEQNFEARNLGAGAPPLKTAAGWLMIYHAVEEKNQGRRYSAGAALLDLNDPTKVIARLPYPLMKPETDYEINGQVNDVVFPTGLSLFDGRLYIYYGGSDNCIAVASVKLDDLLSELQNNSLKIEINKTYAHSEKEA